MRILAAASAVIALLILGPLARPAPAQLTGSCAVKKTEIASANASDQSTSTGWVNLGTAGSITFSKGTGCVAGTFSASAGNATLGDSVRLQILLDGNPCQPLTSNFVFANNSNEYPAYSTEYFCGASIAAGIHTIQVQYHSGNGGVASINQRTLEVRHN
jgi:hypothetical protein